MRVLFTIQTLEGPAGASLYVRDCALELLRQGHQPVVFSTRVGALAAELRARTVPVIDRLDRLTSTPDIIHGNAPIETVAALLHFPETPAVFVCHAWDNPDSLPPKMPRIMRYLAVDDTCRDHLVCQEGIPEDRVLVRFNAVDLDRFAPRGALPARPRRALVFSNQASNDNYVPSIRDACAGFGIEVDVAGQASGHSVDRPEAILGDYDLVFGKARCALEALATGAAVIVCDAGGLAALVSGDNLDQLRRKNFGRRSLENPVTPEAIAGEIRKYDPDDASRVSARVRAAEGVSDAVRSLLHVYEGAIADHRSRPAPDWARERRAAAEFLQAIAPFSNTFAAADRVQAAHLEIRALQARLATLDTDESMAPLSDGERRQIQLLTVSTPSDVRSGETFRMIADLQNGSSRTVSSRPPCPVFLSYHWLNVDRSEIICFEGQRSDLFPVLPPRAAYRYAATVLAPDRPGRYWLRATLVQDQIAWFDSSDSNQFRDVEIAVI
jgi:hypothetical protein